MNCIVKIDGREAVPVRAIPFVTGWKLSPDVVARGLACDDPVGRLEEIRAHHIASDGSHGEMLPKEWDGVVAALRALSDTLKADEKVERASYPVWREQSPLKLPSRCFVWKNEFERAAIRAMNARYDPDGKRPGDNELNFSPRIPEGLAEVVLEGMPKPPSVQRATITDSSLLATIAALLASWPNGKLPSAKDLEKAAQSVDVSVSDDTIRKTLAEARKIAPTLPSA